VRPFAFDLDGTLITCRERQVAVARDVIGELGIGALDEARFWSEKRAGATTLAALREMGVDDGLARRAARDWAGRIEDPGYLEIDRPLPGAQTALERARNAGFEPVIVTARRDALEVARQVMRLDLLRSRANLFVVEPDRATDQKAETLSKVGAVAFVGDTEGDARAAADAGVPFAAVLTGQRDSDFLARHAGAQVHPNVDDATRDLLAQLTAAHRPRR